MFQCRDSCLTTIPLYNTALEQTIVNEYFNEATPYFVTQIQDYYYLLHDITITYFKRFGYWHNVIHANLM